MSRLFNGIRAIGSNRDGQREPSNSPNVSNKYSGRGISKVPYNFSSQSRQPQVQSQSYTQYALDSSSDYELGQEQNIERSYGDSPIGWICETSKGLCNEAQEMCFAPKERMQSRSTPLRQSHAIDCDELSDDEEPVRIGSTASHKNGSISRSMISEYQTPELSIPKLHLFTTIGGSPLSEDTQEVPESRIVAPHVSKLAPYSVIEIRLESANQSVAVLCAVDVLKMRSSFFGSILDNQERNSPSIQKGSGIWRDPIVIPEPSPFEAAAFLESLHEGRSLLKDEWSFCWARLSVHWVIEDLVMEYVKQIDNHINKLVNVIKANNWRTSPNILLGYRISVFRKGPTTIPTILSGVIIEANASTAYSKVRVAFEQDKDLCFTPSTPMTSKITNDLSQPTNVGDVSSPFWVQKEDGCSWMEPDDIFQNISKKLITITDRRIFWEMARSIIDLPQLGAELKCGIKNSRDIAGLLKKPEFNILWMPDAAQHLPKEAATELIQAVYCRGLES